MNIGSTIKEIRLEKKIKQGEFAEKCGLSQTYLSLIESNQKEPNISTLQAIANNLGIPIPILFFLSMDISDVPERKKEVYKIMEPSLKEMIKQIYLDDKER